MEKWEEETDLYVVQPEDESGNWSFHERFSEALKTFACPFISILTSY